MTACPHCGNDTDRLPARFVATPATIADLYDAWLSVDGVPVTEKVLIVILEPKAEERANGQ